MIWRSTSRTAFRIATQLVLNHHKPLEGARSLIDFGAEHVNVLDLIADMEQIVVFSDQACLLQSVRKGRKLGDDQLVVVSLAYPNSMKMVLRTEPREAPG